MAKQLEKIKQIEDTGAQLAILLSKLVSELKKDAYDVEQFHPHSDIPALVASQRAIHKLTQKDLALMADVTPNTMVKLNQSHTNMRVETLLDILGALGLTLYVGPHSS